ncbi:SIMPL domain-containing protein [Parvularcula oceani]|uniref:SIMPL domain-containing protein n=1 Tax=Parvularcula oceani TaxID=1247963 RepID=UPI0006905AE4|nr:SIMPL domain-containing protein [Parvularcula oceani]
MKAIAIAALAPLALAACSASALQDDPAQTAAQQRTITVSGTGEAAGTPDIATLRFSAMSRADTAAAAMEQNAQKMTDVRDALRELGIEARDMQTSSLTLNPYYEQDERMRYDRSKIAGYEASNALMVRLRDIEQAGSVIDRAVRAGANGLDSFSFGFDDQDGLMEEAQKDAVADARATAELLAEEAGVSLGQVITITENGSSGGPQPMMDMIVVTARRRESAPTPVEAGEQTVTANVRITYSLN